MCAIVSLTTSIVSLLLPFFSERGGPQPPCLNERLWRLNQNAPPLCLSAWRDGLMMAFWFTHIKITYCLLVVGSAVWVPLCSVVYKTEELRRRIKNVCRKGQHAKKKEGERSRRRQFWHGGYYSSAAEHLVGGGVASSSSVMFVSFIVVLYFKKLKN